MCEWVFQSQNFARLIGFLLIPLILGISTGRALGACPVSNNEVNGLIGTLNLADTATDTKGVLTYLRQADSADQKMALECPHDVPTFRYLTSAAWFQALVAQLYSKLAKQSHPQMCLNYYEANARYALATSWDELTLFYPTRAGIGEIYTRATLAAMNAAALWKMRLPSLSGSADIAEKLMKNYQPASDAASKTLIGKTLSDCPHP